MEALREFVASLDRPIDLTRRMFWDRYPVRVEFNAVDYAERVLPASQLYRFRTIHFDVIDGLGLQGRTKPRRRDDFTTIYCLDEADALEVCKEIGASIVAVSCPRHAADLAALTGDGSRVKPALRETLYWDRYRFGLSLNPKVVKEGKTEELRAWIDEFCEMQDDPKAAHIDFGSPSRVYFRTENDIFFFKLVFHEYIRDFEKAILIKDIDDARQSSEAVC